MDHSTPVKTVDALHGSNDLNDLNASNGPSASNDSDNSNGLNDFENSNVSNVSNDSNGHKRWYVIYTKPRSEDVARGQLEKKDISVFLPKIRETRFRNHRLQEMVQPLFPSYLFGQLTIPDEYYDVKWAKGVRRIVGSGDMPLPLDDSIVAFLKAQSNETGLIQRQPGVKDGDKVRVRQGPLEGLMGIVQGDVDAKGRVKILMDILHAGAKIEIPFTYIEKHE